MKAIALFVAAAALPLATLAQVQTLYKLIHPDGKVEYAEKPPKDFPGKVVPLNVNPDANTATLPKPAPAGGENGSGKARDEARNANRLQEARDRVEAARKALKDAQDNPSETDITRVGNAGGGARPVPSEAYLARLERLQQAVKSAEDHLRALEGKG
jgi:hypothetical protein